MGAGVGSLTLALSLFEREGTPTAIPGETGPLSRWALSFLHITLPERETQVLTDDPRRHDQVMPPPPPAPAGRDARRAVARAPQDAAP